MDNSKEYIKNYSGLLSYNYTKYDTQKATTKIFKNINSVYYLNIREDVNIKTPKRINKDISAVPWVKKSLDNPANNITTVEKIKKTTEYVYNIIFDLSKSYVKTLKILKNPMKKKEEKKSKDFTPNLYVNMCFKASGKKLQNPRLGDSKDLLNKRIIQLNYSDNINDFFIDSAISSAEYYRFQGDEIFGASLESNYMHNYIPPAGDAIKDLHNSVTSNNQIMFQK